MNPPSKVIGIESSGHFGTAFHMALERKRKPLTDFAKENDFSYESLRKIMKNMASPPPLLLKAICKELDVDPKEMQKLADQDRMERRLGSKNLHIALELPQRASELIAVMEHLTEDQVDLILGQMKSMALTNQRNAPVKKRR